MKSEKAQDDIEALALKCRLDNEMIGISSKWRTFGILPLAVLITCLILWYIASLRALQLTLITDLFSGI